MRYICLRLLEDVTGVSTPRSFEENEYRRLTKFSNMFPTISITVEKRVDLIRKQWVDIARPIILKGRAHLIIPTLFTATKQLMVIYYEHDLDIPSLHVQWLDTVINELKPNTSSLYYYFIVVTCVMFSILVHKII